jgi:hypothetical protein
MTEELALGLKKAGYPQEYKGGFFYTKNSEIIRNGDKCQKEWANFRKFRTIWIFKTPEREKNFLVALSKDFANRMFWTTTESAYRDDIGAEIFSTPKDHEKIAYSFQQT